MVGARCWGISFAFRGLIPAAAPAGAARGARAGADRLFRARKFPALSRTRARGSGAVNFTNRLRRGALRKSRTYFPASASDYTPGY